MPALPRRAAHSLIELLIVIGILAVLLGLLVPAVQKARDAASRISCANNLRQIGLAAQLYHDTDGRLPPGVAGPPRPGVAYPYLGWEARLLPYLDQDALWQATFDAFRSDPFPFHNTPHIGLAQPLAVLGCPADGAVDVAQGYHGHLGDLRVALTSYLGNAGTSANTFDGLLYLNSSVKFTHIKDGISNTILAGERPPAPDFRFGWWYAGVGQQGLGSLDMVLGASEKNLLKGLIPYASPYAECPPGPYQFGPGSVSNPCDVFHYWSLHPGGANFVFADGSVHFINYSAGAIMPALATRAGGEVVQAP